MKRPYTIMEHLSAYTAGLSARDHIHQLWTTLIELGVGPDGDSAIIYASSWEQVAEQLYRVMAIKDEYEVARLHADPAFSARLTATFGTQIKRQYHLAPPLLGRKNATGQAIKTTFGGWMAAVFPLLATAKGLRGTALDVFGYTDERKSERKLRDDYIALIDAVCRDLTVENRALALDLANVVAPVKGFGHVKARNMAAARARWSELLDRWQTT